MYDIGARGVGCGVCSLVVCVRVECGMYTICSHNREAELGVLSKLCSKWLRIPTFKLNSTRCPSTPLLLVEHIGNGFNMYEFFM